MGTAAALAWAAAPLVGRAAALTARALTAMQFGVLGYTIVGRADHHVLLALICRFGHDAYFRKGDGDAALYRRLEKGAPPPWLAEVALPDGLARRFRLFRVAAPK